MQLHTIKRNTKNKTSKRVGRGGKRGTYSGQGVKGQKSRAGTQKMQPIIRELIKKYPKLRGYRHNYKTEAILTVDLSVIEKHFQTGDKVTVGTLLSKKIISRIRTRVPVVKILAKGDIKKKVEIVGCLFSKSAKEKVEKAGGNIK